MIATTEATLTIGVLAERSGCSVPTIRYYEEIGLLPKATRRPNGHRIYSVGDERRLTFVRRCRDFGFTIEQIGQLVGLADDDSGDCVAARDLAQTHLDQIRVKLRELQALERGLLSLVQSCTSHCVGGTPACCTIFHDLHDVTPTPVAQKTRCG